MFNSCHPPYATLCCFESCRMVCSLEEGTRHPPFFDTTIPLLASKCSACHTLIPSLTSTVGTYKVHKILTTISYIPKVIIHSKFSILSEKKKKRKKRWVRSSHKKKERRRKIESQRNSLISHLLQKERKMTFTISTFSLSIKPTSSKEWNLMSTDSCESLFGSTIQVAKVCTSTLSKP